MDHHPPEDYHLRIKHVPGKQHAAPDMLSRRPDADKGEQDNLGPTPPTTGTLHPTHYRTKSGMD